MNQQTTHDDPYQEFYWAAYDRGEEAARAGRPQTTNADDRLHIANGGWLAAWDELPPQAQVDIEAEFRSGWDETTAQMDREAAAH